MDIRLADAQDLALLAKYDQHISLPKSCGANSTEAK